MKTVCCWNILSQLFSEKSEGLVKWIHSNWYKQFWYNKLNSLLCQKSKDFFIVEKRKNCEPKCFGLIFTEDISIRNWINRKPEDVGIVFPKTFKSLADRHNLECFRYMFGKRSHKLWDKSLTHQRSYVFQENRWETKMARNFAGFCFQNWTQ